MNGEVHTVDEISLWIADGGSIHLKLSEPYGDPVELTGDAARELASHLLKLADSR